MFKIKKKRVISSLLSVALVFGLLGSSVVSTNAATSVTNSGGTGTSKVAATIEPSIFSATVPYVLPISIDAEQNVYTADNVAILNNSNGPIKVSDATLTTNEGWELVADGTDFSSVPVNSKQFSMTVLNSPVLTSGSINTDSFDIINGNSSLNVIYDADAAVQGEAISGTNIANVLFTVEWDNVEITTATVSKTALKSFAKTVTTFQKTPERLNIDDVKAADGVTKIDDGTTEKSIYAWSDADGNGYWWTDAMIAYLPTSCSSLFINCENLTSLDLSGFDTSNVTNMNGMFENCYAISSLDLSGFDTSNVTNMGWMFNNCYSLKTLDVSSFDTSNVTDMNNMFSITKRAGYTPALSTLDLSSFDTSKVTSMSHMFYCEKAKDTDVSPLTSLDVSSFDTGNVSDMSYMFFGCENIKTLDISSFDTSSVTNMGAMFSGCFGLTELDITTLDTSNVTNMNGIFSGCSGLTELDVTTFDTSNVTNMGAMFSRCSGLTELDVTTFDTSNVTNMGAMFYGCSGLTELDVTTLDTSNVTNMGSMFYDCKKLTSLNLSSFNTKKVTDMRSMFAACYVINSLDLSSFDTSKVTNMSGMFNNCYKLVSVDLSSFNTSNVTNMGWMFNYCHAIKTIYVSNFSTDKVKLYKSTDMFDECYKIVGGNGTTYNSSYVDKTYARIDTANSRGYFTYKAKAA